ncbi:MAG: ABC transporter permease [Sutterellaceae bacterium]|nr:ABC transporter permease [Sutterellaceae bacterium]
MRIGALLRFDFGRFTALLIKEIQLIARDPSYLVIGLGLPVLMLLIYGFGMSMDVKNVPVSLLVEEKTPAAVALARHFEANNYLVGSRADNRQQAELAFSRREVEAVIRIQPGFARDLAGGNAQVGLTLYGVDSNTAQMVRSYATGVAQTAMQDAKLQTSGSNTSTSVNPAVSLTSRLWFNEASNSTWYLVPGLLVIVTSVSASFLGSLVIAREWERGTMTALFATPAASLEILLSKLIACAGIALSGFFVCLVMAVTLFSVPLRGSVFWLMTTAFLYCIAAAALGLFISAKVKSQFLATECAIMASFMPTMMLSGFLFDLRSVPVWIEWIGKCFPPSYAVESLKICFLSGGGETALAFNALLMLAFAVGLIVLTLCMLSKSPKRMTPSAVSDKERA